MDIPATIDFYALGFTPLDLVAFAWFLIATIGYSFIADRGPLAEISLIGAIQNERFHWMANMANRPDRVIDVLLVGNLAAGNTFFASTSVIMLGALSALLGSGEKVQQIIDRLPLTQHAPPLVWDVKILVMMAIFVYAFFKFAWAFRLAHYAMIMVGATPIRDSSTEGQRLDHGRRTARIAGLAAEHSNLGLRAYYFAIAGIGWFFHPIAFIITTTWVLMIVIRREYLSRTLATIAAGKDR